MNTISLNPTNFQKRYTSPSFGRKLREDEKPEYEKTMNEAFDYLGIKNRALIVHGSSFPSEVSDVTKSISKDYVSARVNGNNPFIGSPYMSKDFTDFVKMNGFNSIQLGPNGKLNKRDLSPYHASIFAKNELFLDYDSLKTDEYANILSEKDLNKIEYIKKKNHKNYDMADFDEAQSVSKIATREAYKNFKTKLNAGDPKAERLNNQFESFKAKNDYWLDKDSMFRLFSDIHGTDDFKKWDNELDQNIISKMDSGDEEAWIRYNQVKTKPGSKNKLEEYKFVQFLLDKQEKEDKEIREQDGMKYIGDLLVGYSFADEWANPSAFLKDWRVGAPDGGKNGGPQLWDIAVLNPNKLFNEDGSLGVSGQLVKQKIERTVDGTENIRVDNVMGLVDPFVYKSSAVREDGSIDWRDRNFLAYTGLDPDHNYPKIMHDILLPTLREHGINPHDVVWENLGSQSDTFKSVFYDGKYPDKDGDKTFDDEKFKGVTYSKGIKMENNGWYTYSFMSTHDNEPSAQMLNQDWIYNNEGWNPMYLAGYLVPPYNSEESKKSAKFCNKISKDKDERLDAKYAELMRGTPNIQVSFADFFGIDKTYNVAGQENKDNWKLRVNSNYEDTYHKSLETGDHHAMNMPKILSLAVNSKTGMKIIKKEMPENTAKAETEDLQARLKHWEEVLEEPEN